MFFNRWLHNFRIGKSGEDIAALYLKKRCGFKIIIRNYRARHSEIDIIAFSKKRGIINIVEVKSRSREDWAAVGESLTESKIGALRRGAMQFLSENPVYRKYLLFFSVVVVFFDDKGKPSVEYIEDIRL